MLEKSNKNKLKVRRLKENFFPSIRSGGGSTQPQISNIHSGLSINYWVFYKLAVPRMGFFSKRRLRFALGCLRCAAVCTFAIPSVLLAVTCSPPATIKLPIVIKAVDLHDWWCVCVCALEVSVQNRMLPT